MVQKSSSLILAGLLPLAVAGCDSCQRCRDPITATDVQTQRMERGLESPQQHLKDMADNAVLSDMAVADFHFVAHTAELSGTGAARLDRLGPLLDTYGGTVRYETFETDEKLVKQRLEHVREYLTTTGCDMARVDIKAMISGGHGMPANKAIVIDLKGTRPPEGQGPAAPSFGTSSSSK